MDASAASCAGASRTACSSQRRGHDGDGYLEIDVQRLPRRGRRPPDRAHPRRGRGRELLPVDRAPAQPPVYRITQSRIHVLVTYGFLRSLARLDLAESRVGRFARGPGIDDVPDPPLPPTAAAAGCRTSSAVAAAGDRAQLRAVVAGVDAADGARARAHHERLRRRAARRGSARPAARRRRSRRWRRRSSRRRCTRSSHVERPRRGRSRRRAPPGAPRRRAATGGRAAGRPCT